MGGAPANVMQPSKDRLLFKLEAEPAGGLGSCWGLSLCSTSANVTMTPVFTIKSRIVPRVVSDGCCSDNRCHEELLPPVSVIGT